MTVELVERKWWGGRDAIGQIWLGGWALGLIAIVIIAAALIVLTLVGRA